jgi:hypothetical protein
VEVENLTPRFDDSQLQLLNNFDGADRSRLRSNARRLRCLRLAEVGRRDAAHRITGLARDDDRASVRVPHPGARVRRRARLEFQLLRDVSSVTVAMTYKGQTREIDLRLLQAATENAVNLTSTQISQEADLGGPATFDLRLDRSTVDVRRFELKIVNLPRQISASFVDANQARLCSSASLPALPSRCSA